MPCHAGRAEQALLPLFTLACGADADARWPLPNPRRMASCGQLGRALGWIAHALAQARLDSLIRPRTACTGRMPDR